MDAERSDGGSPALEDVSTCVWGGSDGGCLLLTEDRPRAVLRKRGQMRPRLMAVFASNLHVQTARRTSHAFSIHKPTADAIKTTIDYLCVLRGVGPAMASLVLSVFDQDTVPFFSDECYRWMLFADRKGQGWDRPIKYTTKEYIEYWEKVQALRKRFKDEGGQDVRAVDVEKVGFVLATEAAAARAREPARASKKRARGDEEEQDKDEEADPPSPRAKRMQRELKKLLR